MNDVIALLGLISFIFACWYVSIAFYKIDDTTTLDTKTKQKNKGKFRFAILEKENKLEAIDIERNIQANSLMELLIASGYKKITIIRGDDQDDAICNYKKSIEKTPLELANEKINFAENKISELQYDNSHLQSVVQKLKRINCDLRDDLDAMSSKTESLKNENASLHSKIKLLTDSINKQGNFNDHQWLGFKSVPSKSELNAKYKRLTLIYHPDRGGCGFIMAKINNAYEALMKTVN